MVLSFGEVRYNGIQRPGLASWRYSVLRQPGYVADQRYEDENIF